MVPAEDTSLIVAYELEGASAWAARRGVALTWIPDALELRAVLTQPESGELFYLRGKVSDYRELPPEWTFTEASWGGAPSAATFPKVVVTPYGSPLFIAAQGGPVICAPFNRLAFSSLGGPHSDWGSPANWLNAAPTNLRAVTIGDMLAAVHRDFVLTRGRMAG